MEVTMYGSSPDNGLKVAGRHSKSFCVKLFSTLFGPRGHTDGRSKHISLPLQTFSKLLHCSSITPHLHVVQFGFLGLLQRDFFQLCAIFPREEQKKMAPC